MRVGIGCRDHSGWAVIVAIGGEPAAPVVLARERVVLVDDDVRMAYHLAADRPRRDAGRLIARVEEQAETGAARALAGLRDRLEAGDDQVGGVAVGAGTASLPDDLDAILGSHALIHAAEGELYRDALAAGAAAHGLPVTRFPHKDALGKAAATLGVARDALDARLKALGKPLGPPWQKDHREAAAAALLVLAGRPTALG